MWLLFKGLVDDVGSVPPRYRRWQPATTKINKNHREMRGGAVPLARKNGPDRERLRVAGGRVTNNW